MLYPMHLLARGYSHILNEKKHPVHEEWSAKKEWQQKFQFQFFKNLNTRHIFWSWLIRCVKMKWVWLTLWKIQSGHDFVYRRTGGKTDGRQSETRIPELNFFGEGYNHETVFRNLFIVLLDGSAHFFCRIDPIYHSSEFDNRLVVG